MPLAKHSAPGTSAAFDYQFERALLWLASSSAGARVGIETEDDVTIREVDGHLVLEQDKHSIQIHAQPFGDRNKDFWNTLATWLDALDSQEIDVEKTRFLMVTNKVLPDCLALRVSKAKTVPEIEACIAEMEVVAVTPPDGIKDLTHRVMQTNSRANLCEIIKQITCSDGSLDTAGENLRRKTIDSLQFPAWCVPHADSVVNELLGWLHQNILKQWQNQLPAWIERDNFINQFHAILSSRQRKITRERSAHLIKVDDNEVSSKKGSLFVKQLHLITDDESEVDSAIRDLIRCNIEKDRLAAGGNITDEDWLSFESTLLDRWERIRTSVPRLNPKHEEKEQGYIIYTDTTGEHRENLAGSPTEQVYLTAGTYHRLAGAMSVGWHPRYVELMSKLTPQ